MFNDYVYELRDPDTLEVFYVGKGSDRRLEAHKPDNEANIKISSEEGKSFLNNMEKLNFSTF
jgi:hypothetical protein